MYLTLLWTTSAYPHTSIHPTPHTPAELTHHTPHHYSQPIYPSNTSRITHLSMHLAHHTLHTTSNLTHIPPSTLLRHIVSDGPQQVALNDPKSIDGIDGAIEGTLNHNSEGGLSRWSTVPLFPRSQPLLALDEHEVNAHLHTIHIFNLISSIYACNNTCVIYILNEPKMFLCYIIFIYNYNYDCFSALKIEQRDVFITMEYIN